MKKPHVTIAAMWLAALVAVAALYFTQQPRDAAGTPSVAPRSAPLRTPDDDRAPPSKRPPAPARPPAAGPASQFRNDRRHTGRSAYVGPDSSQVVWRAESGGTISSQPVVAADGTIVFGSHDGSVHAVDAHGLEKWAVPLRDRVYMTPYVDPAGNVYVGSDADVYVSISPAGTVRWRLATEGDCDTGTTPSGDDLLHFACGNDLWAVRTDGTVVWRFRARSKIYTTPAVDDDGTVYVGSQDDHEYAIAADGRMRWSYEARNDCDASPVIGDDGSIFFGSDDKHVYALTRDGQLRWRTDVDGYVRGPLALGLDGTVIAGTFGPRPVVVALDAETGARRWEFAVTRSDSAELGISSGALVDHDGNVYIGAHDDYLYALTPSGQLRWALETGGDVDSSPVLAADGTLYFGSDDHFLYAIHGR